MTTIGFDIANPEAVAHELAEANRRLRHETITPPSIIELVSDVCEQIAETPREQWASVVADDWIELQQAAMRALRVALGEADERAQRRQLRLLIEELRFRLARLAEREHYDAERPIDEVVRWLDHALPVAQGVKAELLGVHDRTYQRWISDSDASHPSGEDDRRVRLVARVVSDLRHVLTGPGAASWLQRPHASLGEQTPLQVIEQGEPEPQQRLFELVASARSGAAS
jgi:uncharacterized protein (DUF2384 family)